MAARSDASPSAAGAMRSEPSDGGCSPGGCSQSSQAISGRASSCSRKSLTKREARSLEENRRKITGVLEERGGGSMLRGWRREFDPNGSLDIDFEDFCKAASRLSFAVDTTLLFGHDEDCKTMTLEELAPDEGEVFARLKEWIAAEHRSTRAMFRALRDAAGVEGARMSREDWIAALTASSFGATEAQSSMIYDCCDYAEVGFIQDDDVIFLERDPKVRAQETFRIKASNLDRWKNSAAQEYMFVIRQNKARLAKGQKPSKGRRDPRVWLDRTYENLPAVACFAKSDRALTSHKQSREARQEFRRHLLTTYGNELRAFRRGLAPEGAYAFTFLNLRAYCNRHNLHIDVWALWRGLDRDKDGRVTLEDLCTSHALALACLKRWATNSPLFGSCAKLWRSDAAAEVSRERSGTWFSEKKMLQGVFVETLRRLEWPQVHDKQVRKLVCEALDYHGCSVITVQDLEWLDKWMPPEWVYVEPDPAAWAEMKALLVKRYGHPLLAWRRGLDRDDSNCVTWEEFRLAGQKLRYPRFASAWRALDEDISQSISMVEYDPGSADLLRSFRNWALVNFGSIRQCFKVLDQDGNGGVTFAELKRACHKMSWDGDVRILFDYLDVDGAGILAEGRRSVTYNELAFLDSWTSEPTEQEFACIDDAVMAEGRARRKPGNSARVDAITARLVTPVEFSLARNRGCEFLSRPPEWLRGGAPAQLPAVQRAPAPRRGASASCPELPAAATCGPWRARVRAGPARPPAVDDRVADALAELGRTWS